MKPNFVLYKCTFDTKRCVSNFLFVILNDIQYSFMLSDLLGVVKVLEGRM